MTDKTESPLIFPCDFPIKVFGIATAEFQDLIFNLIKKHLPDLEESAIRTRPSQDGKYIAVTVLAHVESKAQLDTIYQELTDNPLVLMAL